jgi:hypothetical protein
MADCAQPESKFLAIATDFNSFGWDCFVEGRIPFSFITTIKPMFLRYHPRGSVKIWGLKFIKSLIDLTHKRWLFRNSNVHYVSKGLTANQHNELTTKIRELMKKNCNALLARHRHFMRINFNILGSGPVLACQVWVANMEIAISVAKVARGNFCTQESIRLLSTPHSIPTTQILPSIPTTNARTSINPAITSLHPNFVTPGSQSCKVCLTRSPYSKNQPHHQPSTNNHKRPLFLTSLWQKRIPMSKTPRQLYPLFCPTIAP